MDDMRAMMGDLDLLVSNNKDRRKNASRPILKHTSGSEKSIFGVSHKDMPAPFVLTRKKPGRRDMKKLNLFVRTEIPSGKLYIVLCWLVLSVFAVTLQIDR